MKLLKITTGYFSEAIELIASLEGDDDYSSLFYDNGGASDGPLCLIRLDDLPEHIVRSLLEKGLASVTRGREADYSPVIFESVAQFFSGFGWCGYPSRGKAYFINESDAALCQRAYDQLLIDGDPSTLAGRVMGY